jgi:phosphotransferase family enzyme
MARMPVVRSVAVVGWDRARRRAVVAAIALAMVQRERSARTVSTARVVERQRRSGPVRSVVALLWSLVALTRVTRSTRRDSSRLTVVDGGWWDLVVDPASSGAHPAAVALGRLLARVSARCDLVVHLEAVPPSTSVAHIDPASVEYQVRWWQQLLPSIGSRSMTVSPLQDVDDTAIAVVDEVTSAAQVSSSPTPRWMAVPFTPPRRELRATGGSSGAAALRVFGPVRPILLKAAPVNRFVVRRRLGAPVSDPPGNLEALFKSVGVTPEGMAAMQSRTEGRLIVGAATHDELVAIAKVGSRQDLGLRHEAAMLEPLAGRAAAFVTPTVRWSGEWEDRYALVLDALPQLGRGGTLGPDDVVDSAIELAVGVDGIGPLVHGDFTPWNVLPWQGRVAVLDWEVARPGREPLRDLTYFCLRKGVFAKGLRPADAVRALVAEGSPGWRLLDALGLDPLSAPEVLRRGLDADRSPERAVQQYQDAMRAVLNRMR